MFEKFLYTVFYLPMINGIKLVKCEIGVRSVLKRKFQFG
jgi:hypothetical protein